MNNPLPDLPLMLADVPRPVTELLRAIGLPAEPLPRMALLADGVGRFVLFDSRNKRSVSQTERARKQGLKPIDLADFPLPPEALNALPTVVAGADSPLEIFARNRPFLDHLKAELELRRGAWVRVADYPFPYQSALCLGIEHPSDELEGFQEIANSLPPKTTHFISSRLRNERLNEVAAAPGIDFGWHIGNEDIEPSVRRTLSHWRTRAERFTAAKVPTAGLAIRCQDTALPSSASLPPLGFRYACHPRACAGCSLEPTSRSAREPDWVSFGTVTLPQPGELPPWMAANYKAGCPLFLLEPAARLPLIQELAALSEEDFRYSLLWRTSFLQFASWWQARRAVRLQVWRRDDHCEVHAAGDFGEYRWAIEIWRGNHVATLPLVSTEMHIQDEGLAYLTSPGKSPSGCTIPHETAVDLFGARAGRPRAA